MKIAKIKIENLYKVTNIFKYDTNKIYVKSFDGHSIKNNFINDVFYSGVKDTYNIQLKNNNSIRATADHKFLTKRGWIELEKLLVDEDQIMCNDGWSLVTKKEYYDKQKTYDISCIENHNFTANNMIVHNSGKGLMLVLLCRLYKEHKILCLFNSIDLVMQTYDNFIKYGFDPAEVGIIQGQNFQDDRRVTIMSVASYEKAYHLFPQIKAIIVDECFPSKTRILTKNGHKYISNLVLNKSTEEVLCFNEVTKEFVYKPITNWYQKKAKQLIQIKFGKECTYATPNHKFYIYENEKIIKKSAEDLQTGDLCVYSNRINRGGKALSTFQKSAVLGMVLGDSNLSIAKNSKNFGRLRFSQGVKQQEYLDYKINILSNICKNKNNIGNSGYTGKKVILYNSTKSNYDFYELYNKVYINGTKSVINILDEINEVSLAFWFMDDGSFDNRSKVVTLSTHNFSYDENVLIKNMFEKKFKISNVRIVEDKRINKFYIVLNAKGINTFFDLIAKYICPSMQYKIPSEYYNQFDKKVIDSYPKNNFCVKQITEKNIINKEQNVYNITVDEHHNYIVDSGLLVANCHSLGSGSGPEMATKVLYACQNAPVRIGLSATNDCIDNPFRQMALYGNLGPIVFEQTTQEKIADGTLVDVDTTMYNVNMPVIACTGNWADSYEQKTITTKKQKAELIAAGKEKFIFKDGSKEYYREMIARGDESKLYVFNNIRNEMIVRHAIENDHVLILYTRREHGEILERMIGEKIGIDKVKRVDGLDDGKTREEAKAFLEQHSKHVILASGIFKQGVDIPAINTLIIAGAGKGTTMVVQRFVRITRQHKASGKVKGKVIDYMDNFSSLSLRQSQKRLKAYSEYLGFDVKII